MVAEEGEDATQCASGEESKQSKGEGLVPLLGVVVSRDRRLGQYALCV